MGDLALKIQPFKQKLFLPVDSSSLGTFRFLFGVCLLLQSFLVFNQSFIDANVIKNTYHFPFSLFNWLHLNRPSVLQAQILFLLLGLSSLGMTVGLCFRTSIITFFISFLYLILYDKALYNDYYYLLLLLSFLLISTDAHRFPALNSLRLKKIRQQSIPFWQIYLLRMQIIIVYFYGALSKLNTDWLIHGQPLIRTLSQKTLFGFSLDGLGIALIFNYAGLFIDLFLGVFLFLGRYQKLCFILIVLFNLTNHWLFSGDVGLFPFTMIAAIVLFVKPEAPREFFDTLRKKIYPNTKEAGNYRNNSSPMHPKQNLFCYAKLIEILVLLRRNILVQNSSFEAKNTFLLLLRRRIIFAFVVLYLLIQILVPLRHLLTPGHPSWTFEGCRFAWRLKLNAKQVTMKITAVDPKTNKKYDIPYLHYLTQHQLWADNIPDMLWQLVQYIKNEFKKMGIENPKIYIDAQASFNGRPYQDYIDPTVDLANSPDPSFTHIPWVIPLKESP